MVEVLERAKDINVGMKVGDAIADPLLRQRSSYREGRAMHIMFHCAALFNEFREIVGSGLTDSCVASLAYPLPPRKMLIWAK